MRLQRLLASRAGYVCDMQRERASMALGSIKNGEEQMFLQCQFWELSSYFAHFLLCFYSGLLTAFAASRRLLLAKHGERRGKHAIHPSVHHCESRNSRNEKKLKDLRCELWARVKHQSGQGTTPPFRSLCDQETKDLQAQKPPLWHYPLTRTLPARKTGLREIGSKNG